jgi:hypothetical protein
MDERGPMLMVDLVGFLLFFVSFRASAAEKVDDKSIIHHPGGKGK